MDYKNLDWHESVFPAPARDSVHMGLVASLAKVVADNPEAPALIVEGRSYSFQVLAERVAGLAEEIESLGEDKTPLAVIQKSGMDAIAIWFACEMAGRAFLLLEPDHPTERLVALMEQAACTTALVDESTAHHLEGIVTVKKVISEQRKSRFSAVGGMAPNELAMIFPTSGSTGKPKLISYASSTLQAKVQSSLSLMKVQEGARVLIVGSHSNYGFMHHALVFLLKGGCICLASVKERGFEAIRHAIDEQGVRNVRFTPSLFRQLAEVEMLQSCLAKLMAVRFSGEPLLASDLKLAQKVLSQGCLIQNVYGSTESAIFIWSSTEEKMREDLASVPIGKIYPLSAYAIKPLDSSGDASGKGELLIRSEYHAIGDYEKGDLAVERFPNYGNEESPRVYHTGDFVQPLEDGNLMHLGRLGRMVKIRGHRVYLSEVEQALRNIKGVRSAAVVDRLEGEKTVLYGFIMLAEGQKGADEVMQQLEMQLPDYMLPRRLQSITEMPLMAGGKVDYQQLFSLIQTDQSSGLKVIHADERLVTIWDGILWPGAHEIDADFSALGGDSIGFMSLLAAIEEEWEVKLAAEGIRYRCTLEHLSAKLGLEFKRETELVRFKSLEVRLFHGSCSLTKGNVLVMPGVGGKSNPYPFFKAGFFDDYNIWSIDFPLKKGRMLEQNRWWISATEIVEGIQKGILPKPKIIIGYSFAGGLAWLVAKLLASTEMQPDFVIMIDAPALHRIAKLKNEESRKQLERVSGRKTSNIFHIKKASVPYLNFDGGAHNSWQEEDAISCAIHLPVMDHLDMNNDQILSLAQEDIEAFLDLEKPSFDWRRVEFPPSVLGCQVFYAFQGRHDSLTDILKSLDQGLKIGRYQLKLDVAILLHAYGYQKRSLELVALAIKDEPQAKTAQFIELRLKKSVDYLLPDINLPHFAQHLLAIEKALTAQQETLRFKSKLIRVFWFIRDLLLATMRSGVAKLWTRR